MAIKRGFTEIEYRTLRNTAFVLRGSGVELTDEQQKELDRIEMAVTAYEHGVDDQMDFSDLQEGHKT
jgi:hypothetical protein